MEMVRKATEEQRIDNMRLYESPRGVTCKLMDALFGEMQILQQTNNYHRASAYAKLADKVLAASKWQFEATKPMRQVEAMKRLPPVENGGDA